jgi:ribulose-5-phosphate 4-epimerase/fuculose-1-phosphate aldolase
MEFTLNGNPTGAHGRKPYLERFIHAALYEARPDINSVAHNHSHSVIPFGVTGKKLRSIMHVGAVLGADVPIGIQPIGFGAHYMGGSSLWAPKNTPSQIIAKLNGAVVGASADETTRKHAMMVVTNITPDQKKRVKPILAKAR